MIQNEGNKNLRNTRDRINSFKDAKKGERKDRDTLEERKNSFKDTKRDKEKPEEH